MKKLHLLKSVLLLCALVVGSSNAWATDPVVLVSGSGTSDYAVPTGWTTDGTVEGGSYLKFDNGTMTSPAFAPHNSLSFEYTVATFGSGTNHPLTIRILNASTSEVIKEETTSTPTSSSYISTGSPIDLGDIAVNFKIQLYAPTGKGVRLRNYSVTGEPASSDPAFSLSSTSLAFEEIGVGKTKNMAFTITPANLTSALSISCDNANYTISPTSISKDASGAQTVTVTATPTSLSDDMSGTITISGGGLASNETVTLTGSVVRNDPALAFDETAVTLTKGDAFTSPTFTKDEDLNIEDITFTSSYDAVATVSDAGIIALGGSTGTAVIKATFAQSDIYAAGEATCVITVNPAGVTPEPSATGYYEKVTSTANVTTGRYLVVNETAAVAYKGSAPADAANNVIEVTISDSKITSTSTTTANEFTIDMTDGSILAATGDYVGRTANSTGINVSDDPLAHTITINEGNAIIKSNSNDYVLRYNSAANQNRFRYYSGESVQPVQLYKFVAPASPDNIDIYVSEAGMATYVSGFDLDYSSVPNLKAYIAVEDAGAIKYTKVNKVPKGTGVLLQVSDGGGKTYSVPTATTTDDMTGNKLVAGTGAAVASGTNPFNYILNVVNNVVAFYRAAGQTVATNRAYLSTSVNAGSSARIGIDLDDETTGICATLKKKEVENNVYYNLSGQQVAQPTKGLYIVNGKKVIK